MKHCISHRGLSSKNPLWLCDKQVQRCVLISLISMSFAPKWNTSLFFYRLWKQRTLFGKDCPAKPEEVCEKERNAEEDGLKWMGVEWQLVLCGILSSSPGGSFPKAQDHHWSRIIFIPVIALVISSLYNLIENLFLRVGCFKIDYYYTDRGLSCCVNVPPVTLLISDLLLLMLKTSESIIF